MSKGWVGMYINRQTDREIDHQKEIHVDKKMFQVTHKKIQF